MALIKLNGEVSHLTERSKISGNAGDIKQDSSTHFRIAGRPASIGSALILSNGDTVTAICKDKPELEVIAIHNHTTGITSEPNWKVQVTLGMVVLGVSVALTFFMYIGVLLAPVWLHMFWSALTSRRAQVMLGS